MSLSSIDPTLGGLLPDPYAVTPAPSAPLPSQPVDAAGGAPASYGTSILDLFKYGIGAVSAYKAQTNAIDYSMWQASNGQLNKAGQPANTVVPTTGSSSMFASPTQMALVVGALAVVGFVLVKVAKA